MAKNSKPTSEGAYGSGERTSRTDDLRIENVTPLPPPEHLIRFFPIAGSPVEQQIGTTREAIRRIMRRDDDRLLVIMGPCSIHDPLAAVEYAQKAQGRARALRRHARDRHARLLRKAAHDRRLEGPHQRSVSRRELPHRRGPAHRPPAPARDQQARHAGRQRVPRRDLAAVPRRPDRLGRDRRAHDREPGAPRARLRACRRRSASRTAPTATSGSRSTRSRPRRGRTTSCRCTRTARSRSSRRAATPTAT